jgi:hypothetical protein
MQRAMKFDFLFSLHSVSGQWNRHADKDRDDRHRDDQLDQCESGMSVP